MSGLLEALIVAGAIVGAVTAIAVFARKAWNTIARFFRLQDAAGQLIAAQLSQNHGTSLLDRVEQTHRIVAANVERIHRIESRLEKIEHATASPKAVDP